MLIVKNEHLQKTLPYLLQIMRLSKLQKAQASVTTYNS